MLSSVIGPILKSSEMSTELLTLQVFSRTNSITLCVKNRLDGWLNWFFNVSIPAHLQLLRLTRLLLLGIMVLIRLQTDLTPLVTSQGCWIV